MNKNIKEVKLQDLSTKLWIENRTIKPTLEYDPELDTLFICFVPDGDGPIVTHYIDGLVAVLYQHADNEIIGLSIEGFIGTFARRFSGDKTWSLMHTGTLFNGVREVKIGVQEIVLHAQSVDEPKKIEQPKQTKPLPVPVQRATGALNIKKESVMRPHFEQVFN